MRPVSNHTFNRAYIPKHGEVNDTWILIPPHVLANQSTLKEEFQIIVFDNGVLSNDTIVSHHDRKLTTRSIMRPVSNHTSSWTSIPNHGEVNDTWIHSPSHEFANQSTLKEDFQIIVFGNGVLSNDTMIPHPDGKLFNPFIIYVSVLVLLLTMSGVIILIKLMQKYKRKT